MGTKDRDFMRESFGYPATNGARRRFPKGAGIAIILLLAGGAAIWFVPDLRSLVSGRAIAEGSIRMVYDTHVLHAVGRLLICLSFLASGIYNLTSARTHIERLREFGIPLPPVAFAIAMLLQFGGLALLLTGWQTDIGAWCLIVFTVVATLIYHRFWTKTDPAQRVAAKLSLMSNTAIVGGLVLLLATTSTSSG